MNYPTKDKHIISKFTDLLAVLINQSILRCKAHLCKLETLLCQTGIQHQQAKMHQGSEDVTSEDFLIPKLAPKMCMS